LHPGPGLTQPSTLKWSVNRVPACLAGVKAGCVRLCRVADSTVWWQVTLRSCEMDIYINRYTALYSLLFKRVLNAINYDWLCYCLFNMSCNNGYTVRQTIGLTRYRIIGLMDQGANGPGLGLGLGVRDSPLVQCIIKCNPQ